MLILTQTDVRSAVTMTEAIEAAAAALAAYSSGNAEIPLRTHVRCPDGVALYMPGLVRATGALGAKVVSVFPGNPAAGLPTITAAMLLQDAKTGRPLALMEAAYLTALRTGAAAGVATRHLARPDAKVLAVYGAGAQARTQVAAVRAVRPIARVLIYDPCRRAAEELAAQLGAEGGLAVEVSDDPAVPAGSADVIVTATTSLRPVFPGRVVGPGTHINAIGSYTPEMQELEAGLLARADLVAADARDAALHESGDLIIPISAGLFGPERVDAELGQIVLGTAPGRTAPEQLTVYKGVGLAALDLTTAQLVYGRALAMGLGVTIDISV